MKIDFATDHEMRILKENFGRLDISDLENYGELFPYIGVLDVFDHVLTEEECEELLIPTTHNRRYQNRYFRFFFQAFCLQDRQPVFINIFLKYDYPPKTKQDRARLKTSLKNLSRPDAIRFEQLLNSFGHELHHSFLKVHDFEALRLFVTLSARESCFSHFFFPELKTAIIGNYDLCFPMCSHDATSFKALSKIAGESSLFIRPFPAS